MADVLNIEPRSSDFMAVYEAKRCQSLSVSKCTTHGPVKQKSHCAAV